MLMYNSYFTEFLFYTCPLYHFLVYLQNFGK